MHFNHDDVDDVGFLIKLISDSLEKKINQELKKIDLTMSQGRILGYLIESEGHWATQKELEAFFDVTHPTIIGILKRLEAKGLVRSEFDAEDKRAKNIYLTFEKATIKEEMQAFKDRIEGSLLNGFSDEQAKQVRSLLKRIYQNVKDE